MSFFYPLTTLSFAYPAVFIAPLLVFALVLSRSKPKSGINFPQVQMLKEIRPSFRLRLMRPVRNVLSLAAVALLTIAAARPQRVTILNEIRESRNIILALDVSKSMQTQDFGEAFGRFSRLEAVQQVVAEFIKARSSDRLGLVVFGSNAYLQAPLTLDHSLLESLVAKISVGMAGDGTAIGDGLGVSLKRIEELPAKARAIILVTDGVSNSGKVSPLQAAKVAKDLGVKVHTIGIGSNEPIIIRGPGGIFSSQLLQQTEFDEETLRRISELTGGVYFNAQDLEGLKRVYAEIDKLEKTESPEPARQRVEEFFAIYALGAFVMYFLYLIFSRTICSKVP